MSLDISAVQDDRLCNSRLLSAGSTIKDDEVDNMDNIFTPSFSWMYIYCCETLYNGLVWEIVIFLLQQPDHLPIEENDIDNMTTSDKESATANGNGRNDSKGGKVF